MEQSLLKVDENLNLEMGALANQRALGSRRQRHAGTVDLSEKLSDGKRKLKLTGLVLFQSEQ